jgi:hypothetical protein
MRKEVREIGVQRSSKRFVICTLGQARFQKWLVRSAVPADLVADAPDGPD